MRLVIWAINAKVTKPVAAFYMLKLQFANGRIYNFRSRKNMIAKVLGVSIKTLNKYLDILEQQQLVSEECDNLVLAANKRIRRIFNERRTYKISVEQEDALMDIQARLLFKVIEQHARKICFKESIRQFEKLPFRKKEKRKKKAEGGGNQLDMVLRESPHFEPSMSARTVAKLLNMNERTTLQLVSRLNQLGCVKTTIQQPIRVGESDTKALKYFHDTHGHWFFYEKKLFVQYGMKWNFLEHPLIIKPLKGSEYVKIIKNIKR